MRCSYRRSTVVICSLNVFALLYVLHCLLASQGNPQSLRRVPVDNSKPMLTGVRYSWDELETIRDANEARRAVEPFKLMERLKEMESENREDTGQDVELATARLKVAQDVANRLDILRGKDARTQKEILEEWRSKESVEGKAPATSEIGLRQVSSGRETLTGDDGTSEESLGTSVAKEVVVSPRDQELEGGKLVLKGPEIEDGIIPGRALPSVCNAEPHTDYDGFAVRWGLTHHQESAADCCQACMSQARTAKPGEIKCNIWVYCPAEEGCFSPDIYEHKQFECWLKQADNPVVNFKGKYSPEYREANPKCPQVVAWASGVIALG